MPPEDRHLRHVIDTMALYVLDGGCAFEQAIMERGRANPVFSFLFDLCSKEHMYYVWRLYSFAQVCFFLYFPKWLVVLCMHTFLNLCVMIFDVDGNASFYQCFLVFMYT